MPARRVRGRFAPSPTGPLHLGSLLAATASYLQARSQQGEWLVRIEDLDPPRTVPGAATQILHTLEAFGFEWTGQVLYQSQRQPEYDAALAQLLNQGAAYPCSCSRSQLQALQAAPAAEGDELHYPGLCRLGPRDPQQPLAYRLRAPDDPIRFDDTLQGPQLADLTHSIGDFVIRRRDGWFAYQLAVVVDDAAQNITEVVRGCDLLASTPRQIAIQQALALHTPSYLHLPIVTNASGRKLSKSDAAPPIDAQHAIPTLINVLDLLQQEPPHELLSANLNELWHWAVTHWQPSRLYGIRHLALPSA